jgi:hypothetical protein
VGFSTTNQNPNQIHKANNNLNLINYSIFFSFFLDTSTSSVQVKKQKSQGSEFLFCSQIIILQILITRREQDNSFLKLKFFKNVLAEILKIKSFSSVAKTMKFKAEWCSLLFTKKLSRLMNY